MKCSQQGLEKGAVPEQLWNSRVLGGRWGDSIDVAQGHTEEVCAALAKSSLLAEFFLFITGHDETAQFSGVHNSSVACPWEIVTLRIVFVLC